MPKFIVERHIAYVAEFEAESYVQAIEFAETLPQSAFTDAGMIRESLVAEEDIGIGPVMTYETEYH